MALPLYDNWVHFDCAGGCIRALLESPGLLSDIDSVRSTYVSTARDLLTMRFLESTASHMLCLDGDIGWNARDLEKLVAADLDMVSGVYCRKNAARDVPAIFVGERSGELQEVEHAPAGFLLIKRQVIERMIGARQHMLYDRDGQRHFRLWDMDGPVGEDVAFCRRWRAMGGRIFMHMGVVLRHYGEQCFTPATGNT